MWLVTNLILRNFSVREAQRSMARATASGRVSTNKGLYCNQAPCAHSD